MENNQVSLEDQNPKPKNLSIVLILLCILIAGSVFIYLVLNKQKNNSIPEQQSKNFLEENWELGETQPLYDHRFQALFQIPSSWKLTETGEAFKEYSFETNSQNFVFRVSYDNFHYTLRNPEKIITTGGYEAILKKESHGWIAEITHPKYKEFIIKMRINPAPNSIQDQQLDPVLRKIIDSADFVYQNTNLEEETNSWHYMSLPNIGIGVKLAFPQYHDTEYYDSTYNSNDRTYTIDSWKTAEDALFSKTCKKLTTLLNEEEYKVVCELPEEQTATPWLVMKLSKINKDSQQQTLTQLTDIENVDNNGYWEGEIKGRKYLYIWSNLNTTVGNVRNFYLDLGNSVVKLEYICSFETNSLCSEYIFPFVSTIEKL